MRFRLPHTAQKTVCNSAAVNLKNLIIMEIIENFKGNRHNMKIIYQFLAENWDGLVQPLTATITAEYTAETKAAIYKKAAEYGIEYEHVRHIFDHYDSGDCQHLTAVRVEKPNPEKMSTWTWWKLLINKIS